MPSIYLTPAAIGYLTQLILSSVISAYLLVTLHRRKKWDMQTRLLSAFFITTTLFVGLLFLDAILLAAARLYVAYLENIVLAIALGFLLQFAYHFPEAYSKHRIESALALLLSLAYALYELQIAIYRYSELISSDQVHYRPPEPDYIMGLILLWIPIAFLRQSIAADPRPASWLVKLWNPHGPTARGAREFALIYLALFALGNISILRTYYYVSEIVYNIATSVGILVILWLFAARYVNFIPGGASVLAKVSVIALTFLLVSLGTLGWVITPPHAREYRPTLTNHQTLRFIPKTSGYDVSITDYSFEPGLGRKLYSNPLEYPLNEKINFTFPFYGKTYTELYVASSGAISLGQDFIHRNMQGCCFQIPSIFPLMGDLNIGQRAGVYALQDEQRLIITWYQMPALYHPEEIYTFQVVLYRNGIFDMTYQDLPDFVRFEPDSPLTNNLVLRGITPGQGESIFQGSTTNLSTASSSGPMGINQNFYLDFRAYLHESLLPLGVLIVAGSFLLLIILPWLLYSSVARPLSTLLEGVQRMDAGNLEVSIDVRYQDDIGFLTGAFNRMAGSLRETIQGLDDQVAERTAELATANERLHAELIAREAAQAQMLTQQRALATLEERERLSRQLHDGLGQVMGYINVQTQAAQTLLKKEQPEAALNSLERVAELSREAHGEIRNFILGLRTETEQPRENFLNAIQHYVQDFSRDTGIPVKLSLPTETAIPPLSAAVEEQTLRIIQEAFTNIRKHAAATAVDVLFSFDHETIQIIITDNGVGFDPQQAPNDKEQHFGLEMMRERAKSVGGRIEIRSQPGDGTKTIVFIPYLRGTECGNPDNADKNILGLRILLVDDSPLFLEGLRNLLMARGLTVIGMAHNGLEAQELARQLRPDIIIMDISMPKCNGLEATRRIKAELPETRIVMLTVSEKDEVIFESIRSGASGYLLKGMEANDFFALLARLAHGEPPLTPGAASSLVAEFSRSAGAAHAADRVTNESLSERQWKILDLAARGLTYKEIAASMDVSEQAIKYHMAQIIQNLNLGNRSQAIAYARRLHTP